MIYVMSDLHGEYDKYREMLKKICFTKADSLYILGDVCDRGAKSAEILLDMRNRSNVYPIMGNHDYVALALLRKLRLDDLQGAEKPDLDEGTRRSLRLWYSEGGLATIESFRRLPKEMITKLLDYMDSFPFYRTVERYGRTYILTHAGLGNYRPDKKLEEYTCEELLETRDRLVGPPFGIESCYLIMGHTPTFVRTGKPEILQEDHQICIDCGAVFRGGRLGCFCLETGEEFYV